MKVCNGKQAVFQGDVMIKPVKEIPTEAKETKPDGNNYVVAHSETGHHHIIAAKAAKVYALTQMVSYLSLIEEAKLTHLRPFDTHEELLLPAGNYEIVRQREGTPEGWRRVAD